MEICQDDFKKHIFSILKHIAAADYVSIDLEMSGIASRSQFTSDPSHRQTRKRSLQQIYNETKLAAETYQVLQVGITCVERDEDRGFHVARPFNFNLSPLFYMDNRFKDRFPERRISFSSQASDFLLGQGFDFGKVFTKGVYYLSQLEELETRERFRRRQERFDPTVPVLKPPLYDADATEFIVSTRRLITAWINTQKPEYPFVNIEGLTGGDLNGFQRLLVYRLVENEFPGYKATAQARQTFMQIEKINPKKEAEFQAKRFAEFNNALNEQIGLRWIFEALTGGDISPIPVEWFLDQYSQEYQQERREMADEFYQLQLLLEQKRHVLVGHNIFTDLVYIYRTFVGALPELAEEFQKEIHQTFPIVFDTKYIATEGHQFASSQMRKTLAELLATIRSHDSPPLILHEEHTSYRCGIRKLHEAGFDSYMTAELFLALAAQEGRSRGNSSGKNGATSHDPDTDGGVSLVSAGIKESLLGLDHESGKRPSENSHNALNGKDSAGTAASLDFDVVTLRTGQGDLTKPSKPSTSPFSIIQSSNPFAVLANENSPIIDDSYHQGQDWEDVSSTEQRWSLDDYSKILGRCINRLRVNASEEGICDLNELSSIQSNR